VPRGRLPSLPDAPSLSDNWGAEKRNGEWEFQAFNADKSVNRNENLGRCFACHKPNEPQDFVFTVDQMRSAELE
jgi:cytochrome P460